MDTNRNPEPPAGMPDVSAQPSRFEGDVRPITYLARGYLRGALPPQGLEAFTRQFRKTADDVLDFYGYWLRFQTEEVTNLIRGLLTGEEPTTTTRRERKINIDTSKANGPSGVSAAAASETPVAPAAPAVTPAADDKPFVEATPPAASEPPAAEPLPDSDEDKNKPGA